MSARRRFAGFLRKAPVLVLVAQRLLHLTQPRVTCGAVGVVFNAAGELLIVEHAFHPDYPWGLPGGWMGRGETPDQTVAREVHEETGLTVQVVAPLLVARTPFIPHHLDFAYLCRAPGKATITRLSNELLSYRWLLPAEQDPPPYPMVRFHTAAIRAGIALVREHAQAGLPHQPG